jgi:aryl-alcohol dehydrogenase-like predicted oxidoreductase
MEYTTLGRSGLEVSRICFGSWQFGGDWGAVEREEATAAVRRALDLGVTFFDAAQVYGFGEVLPWCQEHDVGVLVYGPLAHGLLTGKFGPGDELPADDWRSGTDLFAGDAFERNLEVVEELKRFAHERGHTVAQLAVAWTLAQPAVHVAITGARRPDHVEGVARAAQISLSEDDLAEIDRIAAGAGRVTWGAP